MKGSQLKSVYVDRMGIVWISDASATNKFDPASLRFTLYLNQPENPSSLPINNIFRIYEDRSGNLWMDPWGTSYLIKYRKESDTFITFRMPQGPHSPLLEDSSGTLWVGGFTENNQPGVLYTLDKESGAILSKRKISDTWFTTDMIEDRNNPEILWVSTFEMGLCKFHKRDGSFVEFVHDPENPQSIGDNGIWELVQDREDPRILWLGGTSSGLNRFDTAMETFKRYSFDPNNSKSIGGNKVRGIAQTASGELWVITPGAGLKRFDKKMAPLKGLTRKMDSFLKTMFQISWKITREISG